MPSTIDPTIRRSRPSRPTSSTNASPGNHRRRSPAPKHGDKCAEQPIAAENPRLTRTTDPTTIRLARLKWLSVDCPLQHAKLPPVRARSSDHSSSPVLRTPCLRS